MLGLLPREPARRWAVVVVLAVLAICSPSAGSRTSPADPVAVAQANSATAGSAPAGANLDVNTTAASAPFDIRLRGADFTGVEGSAIWDAARQSLRPGALAAVQALGLGFVRMNPQVNVAYCPPRSDCTYHWKSYTPGASSTTSHRYMSPDAYMSMLSSLGGATPLPIVNVERGTRGEAADWVAYMNAPPSGLNPLAAGWGALRTRNGHPAPYAVHYWEIGNEEYNLTANEMTDAAVCASPTVRPGQRYGCVVNLYAAAMKAVDPTIAIVANATDDPRFLDDLMSAAGNSIDALDVHLYAPPADPQNVTFDTDGQSVDIATAPVSGSTPRLTTYALWLTGVGDPHVSVWFDGRPVPTRGTRSGRDVVTSTVTGLDTDTQPHPLVATVLTGPGTHTLRVTACAAASVAVNGTCTAAGRRPNVDLRHVTWVPGSASPTQLFDQATSNCIQVPPGTLVPTGTSTSQGRTGGFGDAGTAWRSSLTDFVAGYTLGSTQRLSMRLSDLRQHLVLDRHAATPIIAGEYGAFSGCDQVPSTLTETHLAGVSDVLDTLMLIQSSTVPTNPVIAASTYALNSTTGPACHGWSEVAGVHRAPGTGDCTGTGAAYLGAVGADMSLLSPLAGHTVPVTVAGGRPIGVPPLSDQAAIPSTLPLRAAAFLDGGTLRLVIVNASADQPVPVTVTLQRAMALGATALTVAADPLAMNTDGAQRNVAARPLAATASGANVTLEVPRLSTTLLTILVSPS